jgi:hypothetical protein
VFPLKGILSFNFQMAIGALDQFFDVAAAGPDCDVLPHVESAFSVAQLTLANCPPLLFLAGGF